jgi:hypothetical protein
MSTTKKPKRLVGSRKAVFANVSSDSHARIQRRAEAAHLSAAKYAGLAIDFLMEIEDAFGGPVPDWFKVSVVKIAHDYNEKMRLARQ